MILIMWPFSKSNTDTKQAATTLSPFISSALSELDEGDLNGQGRVRTLAECYVYGAIRYLASYDDMQPSSTHRLMQTMFSRHFNADDDEVTECVKYCAESDDSGKEKIFMMEGAGALRRWLVNNDKSVASDLKGLLDMPQH